MTTSRFRPLLKEEINLIFEINNCLDAQNWDRGMFDAFMTGYRLAKYDNKKIEDIEKLAKGEDNSPKDCGDDGSQQLKSDIASRPSPNNEDTRKGKEEDNDCRCCKGICSCEYGCHHIHNDHNDDEVKG